MTYSQPTILLVERDEDKSRFLSQILAEENKANVRHASNPEIAIKKIEHQPIHVLITDIFYPEKSGLKLIQYLQEQNIMVVPVVSVPSGDQKAIIEALNSGAYFYINTPYIPQEVNIIANRALNSYDHLFQQRKKDYELRKSDGFYGIIGNSHNMVSLFNLIEKVAEDSESTVLIQGESGVGKELVAKALHAYSSRQNNYFVPVNCAAIPEELLESELFGYEKGAFTGANQAKQGRLQYANKGTLFLDEIGDMKPSMQAKLLRVLQEKEFEPVGGLKPTKVNVRVIAATHCNLKGKVKEGKFREDLYYRLSVVPINVPPLRERKDDIPLLIDKFIGLFHRNKKTKIKKFSPEALKALQNYSWPGNVRELKNLVQRVTILHDKTTVNLSDLPERFSENVSSEPNVSEEDLSLDEDFNVDFNTRVSEYEDRLILQALISTNGNKKKAAQRLNLKRTTLLEKIKKKNLDNIYLKYNKS